MKIYNIFNSFKKYAHFQSRLDRKIRSLTIVEAATVFRDENLIKTIKNMYFAMNQLLDSIPWEETKNEM